MEPEYASVMSKRFEELQAETFVRLLNENDFRYGEFARALIDEGFVDVWENNHIIRFGYNTMWVNSSFSKDGGETFEEFAATAISGTEDERIFTIKFFLAQHETAIELGQHAFDPAI